MKNFTPQRQALVAAGWRRRDRDNTELWAHEKLKGRLISYSSALAVQTRWNKEPCGGTPQRELTGDPYKDVRAKG